MCSINIKVNWPRIHVSARKGRCLKFSFHLFELCLHKSWHKQFIQLKELFKNQLLSKFSFCLFPMQFNSAFSSRKISSCLTCGGMWCTDSDLQRNPHCTKQCPFCTPIHSHIHAFGQYLLLLLKPRFEPFATSPLGSEWQILYAIKQVTHPEMTHHFPNILCQRPRQKKLLFSVNRNSLLTWTQVNFHHIWNFHLFKLMPHLTAPSEFTRIHQSHHKHYFHGPLHSHLEVNHIVDPSCRCSPAWFDPWVTICFGYGIVAEKVFSSAR